MKFSSPRLLLVLLFLASGLVLAACRREKDGAVLPTSTPSVSVAAAAPTTWTTQATATAEVSPPAATVTGLVPELANPISDHVSRILREFLEERVLHPGADPRQAAPGALLLVDMPEGRFLAAEGVADLSTGQAVQGDDRFEIGSITKLFTAVLLLQLHEEGLVALEDPLSRWLPDVAGALPEGEAITLRQLASHTSGLNDYERDLYPMPQILQDPGALERGYTPQELAAWIARNGQSHFAPGASGQWQYSSAGYALLGLVLEAASGQSLEDLYRTRIFQPLGMESPLLLNGVPEEGQIVHGYHAGLGDYVDVTRWNGSGAWAAGGLAMSASDLALFAAALRDGSLFRKDETIALMTEFVPTGQDRGFTGYGLGIAQLSDGTWGHAGGTPGFAAQLLIWPDGDRVAIIMANSGSANVSPDELAQFVRDATEP